MWIYLCILLIGLFIYFRIININEDPIQVLHQFIKKNQVIENPPTIEYNLQESNIIPKYIFQTWHSNVLPKNMQICVNKLKEENPEFKHFLFDDNDCRNFIQQYFDADILYAFDHLKPGTYKADLWRYCILYIYGGIYLDIKYQPIDGFKFKYFLDKEYFVLERPSDAFWKPNEYGIYNALMICKPYNDLLLKAIYKISENVKNEEYGYSNLYPTGPGLLGSLYFGNISKNINKIYDFELFFDVKARGIVYKNTLVLQKYQEYYEEQSTYQKTEYYATMWKNRDIYHIDYQDNNFGVEPNDREPR